jgi:KTSC domain
MIIEVESSLIAGVEYEYDSQELTIHFKKYWTEQLTYKGVPPETYYAFHNSKSKGRYYLQKIKPFFLTKTNKQMPDIVIKCKIDVTKILKDWLYSGKQGTYLNFTVLYNHEKDNYENNGMITQDVPTTVFKLDKSKRGPILGNCKTFAKTDNTEATPGSDKGLVLGSDVANANPDWANDLPF